ncbi:class I SAM-dependent methyltransferase [Echinicola sp. CAU 1574]|uniref:Class I SAM-dependent methyltransferase n=1 Tax=Echinicola arenosa TaxID=2774144 RepID=A0ABR9AIM3_9BACT|nr:class I SAM-dependent methyltransferase [Echinicola arenosa]MBD8488653.1 class I SAM-dependent methyltransferase [Echinicola arenosa]
MQELRPLACKLCGNIEGNTVFPVREMMFGFQESFDYLECNNCKAIQIVDVPKNLGEYYPKDYYSLGEINTSSWVSRFLKTSHFRIFKATKLKYFKHYHYGDWLQELNLPFSSKIADVGCGNGQLLYEWSVSGYTSLVGIDPFISRSREIKPGLKLLKKSIFDVQESFDCIMMHHSFEHMDNPRQVMKKAVELLNEGGQLLIRIPLADKEAWRHYGADWVQLDAPRHIFLHSEKSIKDIAKQCGLLLKKVVYDSTSFQFWGSEVNKMGITHKEVLISELFSKEQMEIYKKKSLQLNLEGQGDQACFYFVKS